MHRFPLLSILILGAFLRAQSPQLSPQQLVQDAMQKQKEGDLAVAVDG